MQNDQIENSLLVQGIHRFFPAQVAIPAVKNLELRLKSAYSAGYLAGLKVNPENTLRETPLMCCRCGVELPKREGYEPVPPEMRGKLLCDDCHEDDEWHGDDDD